MQGHSLLLVHAQFN